MLDKNNNLPNEDTQRQMPNQQQENVQSPNGIQLPVTQQSKKKLKKWQIVLIIVAAVLVVGIIIGNAAQKGFVMPTSTTSISSENASEKTKNETSSKVETSSKTETKDEYIASCESISYSELARNPEKYKGKRIRVEIKIQQIMSGGWFTSGGYRGYSDYEIDLSNADSTFLQKEWYIGYQIPDSESKLLESDVVEFYGEYQGTETVKRALTNTKDEVPCLKAAYHKLIKEAE